MKFDGRIAVFGGRFITEEIYNDTVEIGKRMAEKNWFCLLYTSPSPRDRG